jgi:competence protein ComEC
MLLQNPLSLGFDIGFQLSCLALLGMGLTNAYWKQLLHFLPERFAIREVFAATCSAQIYTWPLTLYYFGSLSLIAPVANAVVLPLLPFLLSLAFLAPLLSTVPFVYPVSMVLLFIVTKVMNSAVLFFGAIPYAAAKNIHFTFIQTISSLLLMALVTRFWFMHSKKQPYE